MSHKKAKAIRKEMPDWRETKYIEKTTPLALSTKKQVIKMIKKHPRETISLKPGCGRAEYQKAKKQAA